MDNVHVEDVIDQKEIKHNNLVSNLPKHRGGAAVLNLDAAYSRRLLRHIFSLMYVAQSFKG